MESRSNQNRNHAIVIGGSMAGLLAARILTDHYQQVTLLERDHFPSDAGRVGVFRRAGIRMGCWPVAVACWIACFLAFRTN